MLTLTTITSFLVPALVVLLILKLIALPIKIIIRVLINMVLGGIILYFLSTFGIISVSLTWWMVAIVGVLGVPGAIIVTIISFFMI